MEESVTNNSSNAEQMYKMIDKVCNCIQFFLNLNFSSTLLKIRL